MINSIETLKQIWSPEAIDKDDHDMDGNGETEYSRFMKYIGDKAFRRLSRWVSAEVAVDAASADPVDTVRAEDLRDAEAELIHVEIITYLEQRKAHGIEQEVQLPSDKRVKFNLMTREEFMKLIDTHTMAAYRLAMPYLV